ncbi:MAG TPA: UvrD-helicase domain-containing protein [Flavilitoribacter sp.]|nr:UvrD-helicase domain-containing protein [Flavilitoribacter sp.]HMQ87887.1 UvrD-helicase domain-containing protein [Flavilitoribacter sp.]
MNLKIISAGAGSGKTYRLTQEMVALLKAGVRPGGIIATTFTRKAAAELQERVRVRLLEEGMTAKADELTNSLIGTVHSLGVKLLRRFAYEAGVSPEVDIIAEEDQQVIFNQSLATVLTNDRVDAIEKLAFRLGLHKRDHFDWRREVRHITDIARSNNFSPEILDKSRERSFATFREFLSEPDPKASASLNTELGALLAQTIERLENNGDTTKKTADAVQTLKGMNRELQLRGELFWHQWVKIAKTGVAVKSKEDMEALQDFAYRHDTHPQFHQDIRDYIDFLFAVSIEALEEFDRYKKSRGLIDYTDMETLINGLLDHPSVKVVLAGELDLLMVDEFQDTSPIQLELFLKLSRLARYSVWVGDPKQSIYGFRGAEPRLMEAIIRDSGGIKPENIQEHSWRSREDIVFAANAIFTKAFNDLPAEQVALKPKRAKTGESGQAEGALHHWHFKFEGEGRPPGRPWMENCLAFTLRQWLDEGVWILPKGEKAYRKARPGDVAILCRSNYECQTVAEALHLAGLSGAMARSGLLNSAEIRLIVACLKYILNQHDSLSVAEILLLAGGMPIEAIIEDRLDFLDLAAMQETLPWGQSNPYVKRLDELRGQAGELSSAEILGLILEELDLRRAIVSWGRTEQRLGNVDVLRRLARQYEDACNRMHTAASLGGFLLWLNELENAGKDTQTAGEGPEAVNILTYHRSKGLEWPIVICYSLEDQLRSDIWGVDIIPESEEVDLNNVLGNRWLRYWVNPYGDQFRNTRLDEQISAGQAKTDKVRQARQEEARLLYVGITRARDYLVIPSRENPPTRWLNRVWHDGNEEFPTLDPFTEETPWEWEGRFLDIRTKTLAFDREFEVIESAAEGLQYQAERTGRATFLPELIDLNKPDHGIAARGSIMPELPYNAPLVLDDNADRYTVAKAIKAFFTADHLDYAQDQRQQMATGILRRFGVEPWLSAETLLQRSESWINWQKLHFKPTETRRKWPLSYPRGDQRFETTLDLLLDTPGGIVLIQNSGFAGQGEACKKKAQGLAPWLALSREGLQAALNRPDIRTYVHFVCAGVVIELN